jgi:Zn-dependent peptidase ImmA (M78 family)
MDPLVMLALRKASEIRSKHKLNIYQPINIYDLCIEMNINVRFVEINMEGMYFSQKDATFPQILISNQRPFARRVYTCAHELGHHLFNHGSKIDSLNDGSGKLAVYDSDEFLVDTFAGALLMPVSGIIAEFTKRKWDIALASPEQFYVVSSAFGTGYKSLIVHCQKNNLINELSVRDLLRQTPGKILESLLGSGAPKSHFKIIDKMNTSVIDIEVSNFIFLPPTVQVEGSQLCKYKETSQGTAYIAEKSGIARILDSKENKGYFVRIQNSNYIGLAEYRHLEN